MDKIHFQSGNNKVTEKLFRTAKKTYRLADIEKITLKRPFFLTALLLGIASYFLRQQYSDYLYDYEHWICLVLYTVPPVMTWFIGAIYITSKPLNNDIATIGFYPSLQRVRQSIEYSLEQVEITQNQSIQHLKSGK